MSKLTAQAIPFSSVVGTGIMLTDETGALVAQLALLNGFTGRSPEEMVALVQRLSAAINAGQPEGQIKHYKRDDPYDVVASKALFQTSIDGGNARVICDGEPVTVYRNPEGMYFVRVPDEMVSPRFEEIKS